MPIEIDDLAKRTAERIIAVGRNSREKFLRTTPPSSWVWDGHGKQVRGLTLGEQRIYLDPTDDTVAIGFIQGNENVEGVWRIADVIKLTRKEIDRIPTLVWRG
jgi:hypothetical protein